MKKRLRGLTTSFVVIAVLIALIVPVQAQTYTVWGQVFDTDGVTPVNGVDVTVTDLNTADSISYTTAGGGFYQTVFGPPGTSYPVNIGHTLQIVATYGELTNTTTVTATGSPQLVNLILHEETQPIIQFISPTPESGSINTTGSVNISVNVTDPGQEGISVVLLNWNGENETMYYIAPNIFSLTKTNLQNGNYTFKVYANDTGDNWGVSDTRTVCVSLVQINYTINFVSGYNMVGIPINDTSVANASSLITKIGTNCMEVSKWDKNTQTWKGYSAGMPPIFDFSISGGEGCFVRMSGPADVTFEGEPWSN